MAVEAIFKALADPTRLRIARLLSTMELAVGELAQVLGQSQPRVSRHVGILCDAGLAERRREGSWVFLRSTSGAEDADPVVAALDLKKTLNLPRSARMTGASLPRSAPRARKRQRPISHNTQANGTNCARCTAPTRRLSSI